MPQRPSISPISSKASFVEMRRAINALIRWAAKIGIPVPTQKDVVTIEDLVSTGLFEFKNGVLTATGWGDSNIIVRTFTQANLVAGIFTFPHAFGTKDLFIQVSDENNKKVSPDDISSTSTHVIIDISYWGSITGKTFTAIVVG